MKKLSDQPASLSVSWGNQLAKAAGEEHKAPIMAYGIEIFLEVLIEVIFLLLLALLLQVLVPVMIVLATAGGFRLFSGGAHLSAYYRCAITGLIVFLLTGVLAKAIAPLLVGLWPLSLTVVAFLWSLWATLRWAPVDTPQNPLSINKRQKMRKLSILFVLCWGLIAVFLNQYPVILASSALALTWQAFTVTPLGGDMLGVIDRLLAGKPQGRRCKTC